MKKLVVLFEYPHVVNARVESIPRYFKNLSVVECMNNRHLDKVLMERPKLEATDKPTWTLPKKA